MTRVLSVQFWGGDDRLIHCVRALGETTTAHPGFHQLDGGAGLITDLFEEHPPVPVVSLHHTDGVRPHNFPE